MCQKCYSSSEKQWNWIFLSIGRKSWKAERGSCLNLTPRWYYISHAEPDVNPNLSLFTQFFSKLEEKTIAKEAEKTNLQAKSKVYIITIT